MSTPPPDPNNPMSAPQGQPGYGQHPSQNQAPPNGPFPSPNTQYGPPQGQQQGYPQQSPYAPHQSPYGAQSSPYPAGVYPRQPAAYGPYGPQGAPGGPWQQQSDKDFVVAWLLALFLGGLGVDRFYRGFIGLGLLKLVTCGGAGLWALIDLLIIIFTGGKDSKGLPLANYEKNKKVSWIVTAVVVVVGLIFSIISGSLSGTDAIAEPTAPEVTDSAPLAVDGDEDAAAEDKKPEETKADKKPAEKKPAESTATKSPVDENPKKAPAADSGVPKQQTALSEAVATGRVDAEAAETDLQRANVLNARSKSVCKSVPDGAVKSWVGTVESVDANGEGKAVVVLSIKDDIEIGTWNNAFSDVSDGTLIEEGTPLFEQALALAPGDQVTFSGTLISGNESNDKCYVTSNLTEVMSIDSPDYIIKFKKLEKVG